MNRLEDQEDDEIEEWMENWDRRRRMAVAQVLCYAVYAIKLFYAYQHKPQVDNPAKSTKGKKRNAPGDDLCAKEFEPLKEAINNVAKAIREGNAIAKRARVHVYSEEEVFAALVNLGIERNLRYKAYNFLTQNASRVRAFFGCPVEERQKFLLRLMDGSHNP